MEAGMRDRVKELKDHAGLAESGDAIQSLCEFIPYFENLDPKGDKRSENYRAFLRACYESGLMVADYFEQMDIRRIWEMRRVRDIENADYESVKVLLTFTLRAERWQDCGIGETLEIVPRRYLPILKRLDVLSKQDNSPKGGAMAKTSRTSRKDVTSDIEKTIEETLKELRKPANQSEWQGLWAGYVADILGHESFITECRKQFHEWQPLRFYLSTKQIIEVTKKKVVSDVRYLGQTVAKMTCNDSDTPRLSTDSCEEANRKYFGCELELHDCPWDGDEAKAFRSYFKRRYEERNVNGGNPEAGEAHVGSLFPKFSVNADYPRVREARIQSLLLTEFDTSRFRNIRPVEIAGFRYAMPTPLRASTPGEVSYTGAAGGGIDILTRCGSKLCVVEVKSEGASTPKAAIEQAVKYTVFLRELLRSDCGADWWKKEAFGFKRPIPPKLTLFAVCAIPVPDINKVSEADKSFGCKEFTIDGDDRVQLHYFYFKEADDKILDAITSLPIKIQDDVASGIDPDDLD
jgi:hypothetical protein